MVNSFPLTGDAVSTRKKICLKSNVVEDRPVVSTVEELNFEQLRNKFSLKAARSESFIQGSPKIKSRAFNYWTFMYQLLDIHIRNPVTCFL